MQVTKRHYVIAGIALVVFSAAIAIDRTVSAASAPDYTKTQLAIIAAARPEMGPLEREFWQRATAVCAHKYGLPPEVVTAKIARESAFNGRAVGSKGEKGAAQLMPMWVKGFNPFEIEPSLDKGCEILATELKATNGDMYRALRRYNGGGSDGEKIESTKAYADNILSRVYLATLVARKQGDADGR